MSQQSGYRGHLKFSVTNCSLLLSQKYYVKPQESFDTENICGCRSPCTHSFLRPSTSVWVTLYPACYSWDILFSLLAKLLELPCSCLRPSWQKHVHVEHCFFKLKQTFCQKVSLIFSFISICWWRNIFHSRTLATEPGGQILIKAIQRSLPLAINICPWKAKPFIIFLFLLWRSLALYCLVLLSRVFEQGNTSILFCTRTPECRMRPRFLFSV